jgi:large subunit ribosomal protein L23
VKNPHDIIVAPYITEKSVAMSYGDDNAALLRKKHEVAKAGTAKKGDKVTVTEEDLVRKYTFLVAKSANKIEIKQAIEAIYNAGKKKGEAISVTSVRTVRVLGKKRRRGQRSTGYEPDRKKAIITLTKGQILEDYGV